jgi:hypothetical protein
MTWLRRFLRGGLFVSFALLILGLAAGFGSAQQFVAKVDRDTLSRNETLSLEVVYAERAESDAIDFDALLADFEILAIRPSSQTRIENFHRSSQTSWQLTLMPKRSGTLHIPAFTLGTARTRPIDVIVTDAPESPEQGAPLAVSLGLDRERAFVGEQILLTITLSSARSVSDLRGSPPELPNAETTLVSQKEFQRVVQGEAFQIYELTYAVFPQVSGPLEIESLQYTGTLRRSRLVVARTEPRTIEILDPARNPEASRKRPWFPASGVALASEWSSDRDALRVGEPVTRTIRISAAGQHAAAITPLSLPEGDYKQYAEQPTLVDSETPSGILGTRTESVVLVPTHAGELRLPPIEIDWWSTEAQRWKVARLPGETLQVAESGTAAAPAPPPLPAAPGSEDLDVVDVPQPRAWPDALIGGLALLCVASIGCCAWLLRRLRQLEAAVSGSTHAAGPGSSDPPRDESRSFDELLRSVAAEDARSTRRELIGWARTRWPEADVTRLDQIPELASSDELRLILIGLDRALYRSGTAESEIDYPRLAAILEAIRAQTRTTRPERGPVLPPLYPR